MASETSTRSSRVQVLAALALVLVLGSLLAVRLMANAKEPVPAPAQVPLPIQADVSTLDVPCWSCPDAQQWTITFKTDLDLLSPLGNGPDNAAEFFVQFSKELGPRAEEAEALAERRQEPYAQSEWVGKAVPPDDPLLLEAEPWTTQRTMRFYPDLLPMQGYKTRVTNLMFMITLARSWVARGLQAEDPVQGLEDCRKAIRLGRLLRQEDVVLINDLVGLACIHIGTRGVYELAQRIGDLQLALVASVVLGEVAPQRLYTSERLSSVDAKPFLHRSEDGRLKLELPDDKVDAYVEMVTACPDRRFRGEATLGSHIILYHGTPEQQARIRAALEQVAAGDDPLQADFARLVLSEPPPAELFADVQ
jgi:hypothetical protein